MEPITAQEIPTLVKGYLARHGVVPTDPKAKEGGEVAKKTLHGRSLDWSVNPPELIEQHKTITAGKTRTRFPPEPNGYLHIGHAKSMNMNFEGAFEKLGVDKDKRFVFFRYDDTNPEAESQEYIDALANNVRWLGWKPDKTSYSSDYFHELHEMAIKLIKKGKAYCCHQSKADIEKTREVAKARLKAIENKTMDPKTIPDGLYSPWRDRTVGENLKLFEEMRRGLWEEGSICLRMKMDMTSSNPNMWDSVAYRIRYVEHPHAGDEWCVYPTYDYTHCLVDSLEHIDYSICTLEFETRRESYYWLLCQLDLWRPMVYEFARLVMTHTLMSKRKILALVNSGFIRGWDDPRLCTLAGLERRGYTPQILNEFCRSIGVTRARSVQDMNKLENIARKTFGADSPRCMAVLDPLPLIITNLDQEETKALEDYPQVESNKTTHSITLGRKVYIDRSDFQLEPSADFFGLGPNKEVLLKYMYNFTCVEVVKDVQGRVTEIRGTIDKAMKNKCKGTLHWVGETALPAEIRTYDYLFTVSNPDDPANKENWRALLNKDSEKIYASALIEPHLAGAAPGSPYQFERLGYFTVDKDSTAEKLVINRCLNLRDKQDASQKGKSRKEEQAKALAAKEAAKKLSPKDMFRAQTDLYSKFDDNGIPTHDAAGAAISKSKLKKLKKDWDKQKKLFDKKK